MYANVRQNHLKYIIIIPVIAVLVSSCRAVIYNIPCISDHEIFPYRTVKNSPESVFCFTKPDTLQNLGKEIYTNCNNLLPNVVPLDKYLEDSNTAAFLIIRNDTLLYEKYCKNYQENSVFNIFSVTKTFIATLIGIAIDEGKIKNVKQSITDYIPEFSENDDFSKITIKHLLNHTSGIRFSNKGFKGIINNTGYYYSGNLRKLILKAELYEKPGVEINYSSINYQLLGLILERASGTTLSSYLEEKLWMKIGMQYEATWSLDKKGKNSFEKCFSCLNCTAVDLAKLGRLYLNKGVWNNKQILSESFINDATKRDTSGGSCRNFQYNFRLGPEKYGSISSWGLYGQFYYIYPKENIIIIRIGEPDLKYNPKFIDHVVLQIIDQI